VCGITPPRRIGGTACKQTRAPGKCAFPIPSGTNVFLLSMPSNHKRGLHSNGNTRLQEGYVSKGRTITVSCPCFTD
jgi:hypothetical protein